MNHKTRKLDNIFLVIQQMLTHLNNTIQGVIKKEYMWYKVLLKRIHVSTYSMASQNDIIFFEQRMSVKEVKPLVP